MEASWLQKLLLLLLCTRDLYLVVSVVNSQDAAVLQSLKEQWKRTPPSWDTSDDPCDSNWEGIICTNSRVTALRLSTMGLQGNFLGDVGQLTELRSLDLSFNIDLTGPVSPLIGNLQNLTILILAGCSFSGKIPNEIGNLKQLYFLALNSNNFTGEIPPSLGSLSNLYWLDLADNQLTGSLPVSTLTTPGLDQLRSAKHFHFNNNKLSGTIPDQLFSSELVLIHILFDGNQFSGRIPSTLGNVQKLEVLRLDRNSLNGPIPSSLYNLNKINALNLANNQLTGPVPNLTNMSSLNYVDLSNNSFDASEAPTWFSTIESLTTLVLEYGALHGPIPQKLFSFPQLQEVKLKNNSFNSTLNLGDNFSPQLKLVDLENNQIKSITLDASPSNKITLKLFGNPICNSDKLSNTNYCELQHYLGRPYSTSLANCGTKLCPSDQSLSPQSCDCAYPYKGILTFRAPFFRDLFNSSRFESLEMNLWKELGLTPGSVSLQNPFFDMRNYLQVSVELFPSTGKYFNRSEILTIGFCLVNQTFKPPKEFGPCYFIPSQYANFPDRRGGSSLSTSVIIGISVGCVLLVLMVMGVGAYAFWQKKRAERAIALSKPFASWGSSGQNSGGAPQLKGARWFSYDELKKITNNFAECNEIGSGGYGKVYKGVLPDQQIVAVKRAQQGSMQGGLEFKTEIELLSRVHHKNLVSLIGFCFEQGEQMLVYEYVPNGNLRENLSGRSGIHLDWKRRLRVALCSATGIAYLHELADPPIIHRDVKSSNILLDENLNAKVADFGLSKLISDSEKGHVSTQVKGTMGYMDPEYYMTQQLTDKSDVYSFGVVMLELVSAKLPIEKGNYIVRVVQMAMNKNEELYGLSKVIDPTIRYEGNLIGLRTFVDLAMQCVHESAADRPTMSHLVREIETILKNGGVNTNSTSASSSATDYGTGKDAPRHPYIDSLPRKEESRDSFDYSGGYTPSTRVEPK